ncbi:MAG: ribosomal protein S18-alanine N-acetyltransferase [Gemmatimonadota bacterium]|nr:ribosomal protein S18-alanine N-acetyltransferase [Gemmatimonadota bacterium]
MTAEAKNRQRPPPARVTLEPMADWHLPQVMEIENQCFTEPWKDQDFLKLIDRPDSICLVALDALERLAGYCCCWIVLESAELGNIAVHPDYEGRSVARKLLDRALETCCARKVTAVFLEVRASNQRAIELYELNGFIRIGLRRGYYRQPPEDAVIMKLEL